MKFLKKFLCMITILMMILTMAVGCDADSQPSNDQSDGQSDAQDTPTNDLVETKDPENQEGTLENTDPSDPTVLISLKGTEYTVSKSGIVSASGNVLTITKPGTYKLTGTLENAQIRVLVEKTETVDLIFAGLSITNKTSAPIYIESADKVSIELAAGTENVLTDGQNYVFAQGEDKPNACLYSSEDLTIKGEGSLTVNANYNNGIGTKNDLKIKGGNITVTAENNAIKGNDSVKIEGGNITVKGSDGIKSDSLDEGKGYIQILGGTVSITAGDDGLQAVSDITVAEAARVTVRASDQDVNCDGTTNIAQGALISA